MKNRLTTQVIFALLCLSGAGQLAADASPKAADWYQLIDGRHCVTSVSPTSWIIQLEVLGAPFRISEVAPGSPVLIVNGSHVGADMRLFLPDKDTCMALRHRIDVAYDHVVTNAKPGRRANTGLK